MNIENHIPFSSYELTPISPSQKKQPTESPSTVASASIYDSDGSSSQVSIENVSTNPIAKGILKGTSAYSASGKIPTAKPGRSVSFAKNSTAADGEKRPTTMAPMKVVTPNNSRKTTTSSRPNRSAPQSYLPEEYASDPTLEKAVTDAGKFISGNLRKAASAVSKIWERPELLLFPDEPPKSKQSSKSAPPKSGK